MLDAIAIEARCWNRIGVWGREASRCPELEKVVHCMNCGVYTDAASKALNREIPADLRVEWQRGLALEGEPLLIKDLSVLILRIGGEWLAISADLVNEILDKSVIRSVPYTRNSAVLGITAVQGQLQLCISLLDLLRIPSKDEEAINPLNSKRFVQRMIVVRVAEQSYVCPCDEVAGIVKVNSQALSIADATQHVEGFSFRQVAWQGLSLIYCDDALLAAALKVRGL